MSAEERLQRLERSVEDLLQDIERLPDEVLYRAPRPGEWSVMSTLAHLAEILPYWAHQAESIVRAPGQPFGRTHEDPDRIAAVEDHAHDSLDAMVPRIRSSLNECLRVLRGLPPEAWQLSGQHARRGSMTITEMVDAFLVDHAVEHARQTQATLGALQLSS